MEEASQTPEIQMDAEGLCREEVFTDNRIGTIHRLTPVTANGDVDTSRQVQYIEATQIMIPGGALPLNFEIPADSLQAAVEGFGTAAQQAVEQTMEELRELQRQQSSSIVIPKTGMALVQREAALSSCHESPETANTGPVRVDHMHLVCRACRRPG